MNDKEKPKSKKKINDLLEKIGNGSVVNSILNKINMGDSKYVENIEKEYQYASKKYIKEPYDKKEIAFTKVKGSTEEQLSKALMKIEALQFEIARYRDALAVAEQKGFIKAHNRALGDASYYAKKSSQLESEAFTLREQLKTALADADRLRTQLSALDALLKDRDHLKALLEQAEVRIKELEDERAHRRREGATKFGSRPRSL